MRTLGRGARLSSAMRGVSAALFFSFCVALFGVATAWAAAPAAPTGNAPEVTAVPGVSQFADGLTLVTRHFERSPVSALELWVRCPANGYGRSRPGIARLAALAVLEHKVNGVSLRDRVRKAGGQITISVYPEGTELAVLAPTYLAPALFDQLLGDALHPRIAADEMAAARQRLAAQQVAAGELPGEVLRDAVFARLFASGPLQSPTYGDAATLAGLTLNDVSGFVGQAYVPSAEIAIAIGGIDASTAARSAGRAAPPAGEAVSMPESAPAAASPTPMVIERAGTTSGIGLGWAGPPASDEQSATAMDFLSDYLAHPSGGILEGPLSAQSGSAMLDGQFVTLRNPGVFYLTAVGDKLDPAVAVATLRKGIQPILDRPLSADEFSKALHAFQSRLWHQLQTQQQLADNYGWYFTQNALAYSPSAMDAAYSSVYLQQVKSLTPAIVHDVARRFLGAAPAIVELTNAELHTAGDQPAGTKAAQ